MRRLAATSLVGAGVVVGFILACATVKSNDDASALAQGTPTQWSPTKPSPSHDVYYPGTEELKPDEMRVIACGSGIPTPGSRGGTKSGLD